MYPHIETAEDFARYVKAVESFKASLHEDPAFMHLAIGEECGFSWRECDCCQRALGGDRSEAKAVYKSGATEEYAICDDCVYFEVYGRLDDSTMMKIGETR